MPPVVARMRAPAAFGRPAALLLAVALPTLSTLPACVESHFREIATQAAAQQSECEGQTGAMQVKELEGYAYQAETCRGPAYYRCYYQRKTMGRVQCCGRVETYEEATATIGGWSFVGPPVCREL